MNDTADGAPRTEERELLRATVHDVCASEMTRERRRELIDRPPPFDDRLWRRLSVETGLTGVGIPEDCGGAGGGLAEVAIVVEGLGAALAPVPYLTSIGWAAQAIVASGDVRAMQDLLPELAAGTAIATLALDAELRCWDGRRGATVTAVSDGGDWVLTGRLDVVPEARIADRLILAAATPTGPGLFVVDLHASGVAVQALATLDLTRSMGSVLLSGAAGRRIATSDPRVLTRISDLAVTALASEQAGGAGRALEMAVGYAKERVQFGRAIGSFQAIKHLCADMLVLVESARSAAFNAAGAVDAGGDLARAASIAGAYCSEAYVRVAEDALHVHGGIGFTYEHDAHLYVRRAKTTELLLGTPSFHRQRLADLHDEQEI